MKTFTVVLVACVLCGCATSQQRQTSRKLKSVVLPEVDFKEANVSDVMKFLFEASLEYDPAPPAEGRGVGFILNLTQTEPKDSAPAPPRPGPKVTLHARCISILDALNAVSKATGVEYTIHRNGKLHLKE